MKTILIVDDDAVTARAYKTCLERDGYQVAVASDGASGLDLLAMPRAPASLLKAAHAGRSAQLETAFNLFASNALRNFRSSVGDPAVVISAHQLDSGAGEVRVSLSSCLDDTVLEGFRWPLHPLDDLDRVERVVCELLQECRVSDFNIPEAVLPERLESGSLFVRIKELQALQQQVMDSMFQTLLQRLQTMQPGDLQRTRQMLEDLNRLLEQREWGEEGDFNEFLNKYRDMFPNGAPESLDELLEQLAHNMQAMQSLLNSLSEEKRQELQQLMQQVFGDERLQHALNELMQYLQAYMQQEGHCRRRSDARQHADEGTDQAALEQRLPARELVHLVEDGDGRGATPVEGSNPLAMLGPIPVQVDRIDRRKRPQHLSGERRLADLAGAGDEHHLTLEVGEDGREQGAAHASRLDTCPKKSRQF